MSEDRPAPRDELLRLRVEDESADEVGRKEVRRELDARERRVEPARERLDGERLREAGHALEQEVSVGEQPDDEALDERVLADDHLADLRKEGADEERLLADALGERGGVEARRGRGRRRGGGAGRRHRHCVPFSSVHFRSRPKPLVRAPERHRGAPELAVSKRDAGAGGPSGRGASSGWRIARTLSSGHADRPAPPFGRRGRSLLAALVAGPGAEAAKKKRRKPTPTPTAVPPRRPRRRRLRPSS